MPPEFAAPRLRYGPPVESTADLPSALRQSDLVHLAIAASSCNAGTRKAGRFIAAVGAMTSHKQEIDPALLASAVLWPTASMILHYVMHPPCQRRLVRKGRRRRVVKVVVGRSRSDARGRIIIFKTRWRRPRRPPARTSPRSVGVAPGVVVRRRRPLPTFQRPARGLFRWVEL
jgi:ornithine cyclodeaminase/alanine dehydrogenase-like protein (mu-crystallin family)